MANSVDPDQTPHHAASDPVLHCLHRSFCPNTSDNYDSRLRIAPRTFRRVPEYVADTDFMIQALYLLYFEISLFLFVQTQMSHTLSKYTQENKFGNTCT